MLVKKIAEREPAHIQAGKPRGAERKPHQKVILKLVKGDSRIDAETSVSRMEPGLIQAAVPSATFCARPLGGEVAGSVRST